MSSAIRAAIAEIPEEGWTPIPYWIEGGADVAEVPYTAFKGSRDRIELRLIVRRVRPTPGSQLALDVVFDHHALVTDLGDAGDLLDAQSRAAYRRRVAELRPGQMLEVEADHRAHARDELVIRDLKDQALAHLPPGKFCANAAWLNLAVLAHNIGRWTLTAAAGQYPTATVGSLRRKLLVMPARLVNSARRLKLRAPTGWPWADALATALTAIRAIPAPG